MPEKCVVCGIRLHRSCCEIRYFRASLIDKKKPKYCSSKCAKIGRKLKKLRQLKARRMHKIANGTSYRAELLKALGNSCVICGESQNIVFHEIHGKKHPNLVMARKELFLGKDFEFCPICRTCHTILTLLAKRQYSALQYEKLRQMIAQIQK